AMGLRGRYAVCARFDRRLQGEQIEALFRSLLPDARHAAAPRVPAAPLPSAAVAAAAREGRAS
ncbi:MAG: hypothetical protein AB1689_20630, partial [Thermodesulfobacteriota bacterium]